MPNLYIIAGCNGAGKTTASYTILPEMLNCREFVNADSIAAGLSPFNPESVAIEAGRLMLNRIDYLINVEEDFAIETTLATRSYVLLLKKARQKNYQVKLIYFWLRSPEEAKQRVLERVRLGGHYIPEEVIKRRYFRGLNNLFKLYISICDIWMIVNNSLIPSELICEGKLNETTIVHNDEVWQVINMQGNENGTN